MSKLGWMVLQAAIAAPVYFFCVDTLHGKGLAPGLAAMGCALLVTLLLGFLLDLPRRIRVRNETKRHAGGLSGVSVRAGDSLEHWPRLGVGQDSSKLPKISP